MIRYLMHVVGLPEDEIRKLDAVEASKIIGQHTTDRIAKIKAGEIEVTA
jgi:hypothetical protein